jgi:hypothetical protein
MAGGRHLFVMPRFFLEVPHEPTTAACNKAIEVFLRTGSHFLTNADWGCKDGEHKAWLTIEVATREEARSVVPAQYRAAARVVQLNKFTMDGDRIVRSHSS